jgi:hypothetical protein
MSDEMCTFGKPYGKCQINSLIKNRTCGLFKTLVVICCLALTPLLKADENGKPRQPPPGDKTGFLSPDANPFVSKEAGLRNIYHPFFDYCGVYGKFHDEIRLDYFGFRNEEDLYFDQDRDGILIILTSGSEGAGYSHRITVAEHIEAILNEKMERKVRVLNLSMNSYCISQEISTFIHLGYHLKPDFVVCHSGWNDMFYSRLVPENFRELGLAYPTFFEDWAMKIHPQIPDRDDSGSIREGSDELIIRGYLLNLEKYRTLVEASGARFIVGLQGFYENNTNGQETFPGVFSLMKQLSSGLKGKAYVHDFTLMKGLDFVDAVHSSDKTSRIVGETYAGIIFRQLNMKEK